MKVSCDEGVASHVGPESCGAVREGVVEALTGESAGRVLSLENPILRSADVVLTGGRQQRLSRHSKGQSHSAWSETPRTHRSISQGRTTLPFGSREIPGFGLGHGPGPCRELARGTTAMDEPGKSDEFIVPVKSPNKAGGAPRAAEGMEGRDSAKGNLAAAKQARTPSRIACLRSQGEYGR